VAEELLPFLVGGSTVFLAGAEAAAAGDEGPVAVDDFLGIDGLIAHGRIDVAVPGDELGDVRRHAVHDGIGDEQPPEIMGGKPQRGAGGVGEPAAGESVVEQAADDAGTQRPVLQPPVPLEQQGHRRVPYLLVFVVGGHQGDPAAGCSDAGNDGGEDVRQLR
jgi:hypothetical protein